LIGQAELLAPDVIWPETANALWSKVARGEIVPAEAMSALAQLLTNRPFTVRLSEPLAADALAIALTLNHPVYDAVYLALARAEGCRLVTADDRLLRAVDGSPLTGLVTPLVTK